MALLTSVATWSVTALGSVAPFAVTSETFNLTLPSATSRVPFAVMSRLSDVPGSVICPVATTWEPSEDRCSPGGPLRDDEANPVSHDEQHDECEQHAE